MCAISLAITGYTVHRLRLASLTGGVLMPGMTEAEVRYLRNAPPTVTRGGLTWIYPDSDTGHSVVRFSPGMNVRSISCFGVAGLPTGCTDILGVTLGTTEDNLVNRIGPPSSTTFIPNGKILVFNDLGLAFTMREYRVASITKFQRSGRLGFLPRAAWFLLP